MGKPTGFIWCSDLHLKPASSYRKTLLTGDAFYALDQIEEYAVSNNVAGLILGGDVYDNNQPPGEAINRMAQFVERLQEKGIMVLYIEGNHDRINPNPYLPTEYYVGHKLLDSIGAVALDGNMVTLDGLRFTGIDYCSGDKLLERLDDIEECDVLCLHTGFKHLLGFEDAYDITVDRIPDKVKKIVLVGHIHVQSVMGVSRPGGGLTVYSSGSTWPWRYTEAHVKHGFYHFNGTEAEYVELDCRKYFDIDEEQDILDTMQEEHVLPPVLRYVRDTMPDLDHAKYPGVRLVSISGDREVEQMLDMSEDHAADLLDALKTGVSFDDYPLQYMFLNALLRSEEPNAFVREYLVEQGALMKQGV